MANVKISGMTAANPANLGGTALFETTDSNTNTVKATYAQVRTVMFAGGSGYTATDPLTVGAITASGDLAIATNKFTVAAASGNTVIAGTLGVTGQITGNVTGNLTGNASGSAATLNPGRTINGVAFDGSTNITITATASGTLTFGTHLTSGGSSYNGSTGVTITSDATSANTASTIVARDASGNFIAGTITANLTGNASGSSGSTTGNAATATALQNARTINGTSFDGTANITVTADANTLTGTVLHSTVVTSSLTALGTIGTGVWQGTVVGATYGGTGVNNGSSTITLGGSLTLSGAFTTTLTVTGTTSVTLPTSGTLVNSAVTTLSSLTTVGVLASTHLTSPTIDSGGLTITSGTVTGVASTWTGTVQVATLTATNPVGAAYGGTGIANGAGSTLTLGAAVAVTGANAITLTTHKAITLSLPYATGSLSSFLGVSGTSVSTSATSETNLVVIKIPAGTWSANGVIRLFPTFAMTGANGNRVLSIRLSATSGDTSGGTQYFLTTSGSANLSYRVFLDIAANNATNSQKGFPVTATAGFGNSTTALTTSAIDTTSDCYININASVANAGDSVAVSHYTVALINP